MLKYLLFDLDGTLTDSQEGLCKSFQHALNYFGITETDPEKLKRFIGPPAHHAFCEFYNFPEEKAIRAVEVFRERFESVGIYENKLYNGIFDMLSALKSSGFTLAVSTGKPQRSADIVLDYFNITQFFDCVVGTPRDNKNHDKTHTILEALEALNADKHSCVMIGDRKFDIEAAKTAGIKSIGVAYGYAPEGELFEYGADYIAASVPELRKLIFELKDTF